MENLTEIKTWGGKRPGAGRKKDPNSQRADCEKYQVSAYRMRRGRLIHEFDAAHGTTIEDFTIRGDLRTFEAVRLARLRLLDEKHGTGYYNQVLSESGIIGWQNAIKSAWQQSAFLRAVSQIESALCQLRPR
jgi:hypothetical protein